MELALLFAGVLILLFFRVPVAFAFLGPCLLYMSLEGHSVGLAARTMIEGVNSFPLLAVPLFVFVGVLANQVGIAHRIFDFAEQALSRVPGRLAYVNVFTSVGFSWMSGSALADSAGLGKIQIPAMMRAGYPFRFAAGLTASSSLISPVMPPSIPAVIFAGVAAVSTGALFAASVIPALLMATGLTVYVFLWTRKHPELRSRAFDARAFWRATWKALGAIGAPVIVLGGVLAGLFTPTEAAGLATVYIIILGLAYRVLTVKLFWAAAMETVVVTGAILVIIASATLLGWILARERISQVIAEFFTSMTDNALVFLILVNILLIVLGAFVEGTAVILVTVPVLLPVAVSFGIDPVHFGVIMIVNLMIGLLTPPVGAVLYVMSSVADRPVDQVFRGVSPFLVPLVAVLVLITAFPQIVMFLPGLLGY
jgi:tripartite ATP-independent transporter DctM subunit